MSTQGYSTTELLALRAVPLCPHPPATSHSLQPPTSPRRAALQEAENQAFLRAVITSQSATFAFANYEADPFIEHFVVPNPQPTTSCVTFASRRHPRELFTQRGRLARWLRYGRSVACFNLYPACRRDLIVNDFLWTVAQKGEYDPKAGNILLENNVLSLAMPRKFFAFLKGIDKMDLKICMLQVLALIAEDEDAEGLALMSEELDDTVWDDLENYMASSGGVSRIDGSTERGLKLMRDVEMLLRLCYLSPWTIDVYASYVTPQDMATVLSDTGRGLDVGIDVSDRKLVRSGARRPVSAGPLPSSTSSPPRARSTQKTMVFWKLFLDWRRYRKVLVQGLGIDAAEVTKAMLYSIIQDSQKVAWDRAELIMACSGRRGNLFSSLPREVVFNIIAPHVLLAGSRK